MAISVSSGVLFNLDAVETSQRERSSATRRASVKPLVAEVCICDTLAHICTRPSKCTNGVLRCVSQKQLTGALHDEGILQAARLRRSRRRLNSGHHSLEDGSVG